MAAQTQMGNQVVHGNGFVSSRVALYFLLPRVAE